MVFFNDGTGQGVERCFGVICYCCVEFVITSSRSGAERRALRRALSSCAMGYSTLRYPAAYSAVISSLVNLIAAGSV